MSLARTLLHSGLALGTIAALTIMFRAHEARLEALLRKAHGGATVAEALCDGRRFPAESTGPGPATHIRLDVAGVNGALLVDYGATRSSLSAAEFPRAYSPMVADVDLPGFSQGSFALRRYRMSRQPDGGQLGVLGTDFLSLLTTQFSGSDVHIGEKPCDAARLRARGFTPISQDGFFSADLGRTTRGRPNVPVVFVRLGDLRAFAQIDTGYDDSLEPHSVDVNESFFDALERSGATLERGRDIWVATCSGRESRRVYKARGLPLLIETEAGELVRRVDDFTLIVKRPNGCGGIAIMSMPAAQLGASFLRTFGTTIFDPRSATVWIAPEGGMEGEKEGGQSPPAAPRPVSSE